MKKAIAKIMLTALVAVVALAGLPSANAASINSTLVVTPSSTVESAANNITLAYTSTVQLNTADTDAIYVTVRDNTGTPVAVSAGNVTLNGNTEAAVLVGSSLKIPVTVANVAAGAVTIVPAGGLQITNPAGVNPGNQVLSVSVTTTKGDFGARIMPIENENQVVVTAIVEPTLSMTLSGNAMNLGIIPTTTVVDSIADLAGSATTLTVSTNAANGYSTYAQADACGAGKLCNWATTRYESLAAGTAGFAIRQNGGTATPLTGVGNIGAGLAVSSDENVTNAAARGISTWAAPVAASTTIVEYGAAVSAVTPAGAYNNTITYSVVGNF